jgi:hypothetical protein
LPATIQEAIQAAGPGSTITIPSGTYDISGLVLPGHITLQASGSVTLVGDLSVSGPNTVINGFTFAGGKVDIGNSDGVIIKNNDFEGGSNSIHFDGAHGALIANNSFHNVTGNVIDGWGLDRSTISGNQFYNSWQPINLEFNNDPTHGRDITIEQNYFTGTQRMDIEVGPVEAYTSNMVVKGNWSENMNNAGPTADGQGTDVAYSLVPSNGVNTHVEGNYASGPGTGIGIELNGSGEIIGNYIDNYWYGTIVYGSGYNVHDNAFVHASVDQVLNYSGGSGVVHGNVTDPAAFAMPQMPGHASSEATTVTDPLADPAASTGTQTDPAVVDPAAVPGTTDAASGTLDASTSQTAAHSGDRQMSDPATTTDPVANAGTADPAPVADSTASDPTATADPPSSHATVSVGGVAGQDPAFTAPDSSTLEAAYKALIHGQHSNVLNFDVEGAAAQDPSSIALRDHALADLQGANSHLKVAFTLTASSTGLDAIELGLLQSAKDYGVRVDAVKILIDQSTTGAKALTATHQQLADLGLDAKVGVLHDTSGSAASPSAAEDGSGSGPHPFEFSGLLHHAHHVG